jgi:hypothetical protein
MPGCCVKANVFEIVSQCATKRERERERERESTQLRSDLRCGSRRRAAGGANFVELLEV